MAACCYLSKIDLTMDRKKQSEDFGEPPFDYEKWRNIENPLWAFGHDDVLAKFHYDFANQIPPTELFHYTTSSGLIGMLQSQCFFATERSYLNDLRELHWGIEIIEKTLVTLKSKVSDELLFWFRLILDDKINDDMRIFIASFSEANENISQWQNYADNSRGYAVGFSGETLRLRAGFGELKPDELKEMPKGYCYYYHLLPVIYDEARQKALVCEFVKAADDYGKILGESEEKKELLRSLIQFRIKELLISFKAPGWKHEAEWRIVATLFQHDTEKRICFRETRYGITPFVKLNLSSGDDLPACKLPITSVTLGSQSEAIKNPRGLEMLLGDNGMTVPVRRSTSASR